jgi:hypothetical protein
LQEKPNGVLRFRHVTDRARRTKGRDRGSGIQHLKPTGTNTTKPPEKNSKPPNVLSTLFPLPPRSKKKRAALKYEIFLHGIKSFEFDVTIPFPFNLPISSLLALEEAGNGQVCCPPTFLPLLASNFSLGSMVKQ